MEASDTGLPAGECSMTKYQAGRVVEMILQVGNDERLTMVGDPMVDLFDPSEWWLSGGWMDSKREIEVMFDSAL